jgi:hypothetical protein
LPRNRQISNKIYWLIWTQQPKFFWRDGGPAGKLFPRPRFEPHVLVIQVTCVAADLIP